MSKTGIWLLVLLVALVVVAVLVAIKVDSQAGASVWRYWTAPWDTRFPGDTLKTPVTAYDLRFAESPFDTVQVLNWQQATVSGARALPTKKDSSLVTGLKFSAIYGFLIRSRDSLGNWSAWSNLVVDTTADGLGPTRIGDFH